MADYSRDKIGKLDLETGAFLLFSCLQQITLCVGLVTYYGSARKGYRDGPAEEAEFKRPSTVAFVESDGSLLVLEKGSNNIRKISFEGI